MKLTDLNPRFYMEGCEGISRNGKPVPERHGMGLICDCPCGCDQFLSVPFKNPIDPGEPQVGWQRDGDTFETMTLSPSILRSPQKGGCGWHGWIRNGEVISC